MYTQNSPIIYKKKDQLKMDRNWVYLLVIFAFLLPISLTCDYRYTPMNGKCAPYECSICKYCEGDSNYCTECYNKALIRGKCECDDIACEFCHSDSSECIGCKDGFYPDPSPEGDCIQCAENCPYCGHKTYWNDTVCYKCEEGGEGYNVSRCTTCPKNCERCGITRPDDTPIKEFICYDCEDGYSFNPTEECSACLGDNCRSCEYVSLDKCTGCIHGKYLHEGKCVTNPPNCEEVRNKLDPVQCKTCNPYFYLTPDKLCKSIHEDGCKYWDNNNLICMDGCIRWDYNLGVCTLCKFNYFPLTTYANISSHIYKYKRCNLTCNTVTLTYTNSYDQYSYCLTENKCPSGYYLNKYKNCVSCLVGIVASIAQMRDVKQPSL